ncbi:hypothetical protein [Mycobacterium aquaticum]|uniref:Transmembrane protein n=1 Tax=Mycobacterium aquaticum TaxID=1927124 RepID=A0A1X0ACS5_9MYCO|nr:hypothetical protein [Mycobacterium aquaticum]ORA27873.1 hypothetical protein BST13_29480 [Mycobacterium aquaticum]
MFHNWAHFGPRDVHGETDARAATRFGFTAAGTGAALLIAAAAWLSTCAGATAGGMACGASERSLLALAAPAVLLVGGIRAFARAYQVSRRGENWRDWQRAALTLMALTLLALTLALSMLARSG